MRYQTPPQKQEYISRGQPALLLFVIAFMTLLTACETPTGLSDAETAASEPNALLFSSEDAGIFVDADGIARPLGPEDVASFSPAVPGERSVALVITGSATFDDNAIPALRVNVRQTKGGAIAGQGRVTMREQTTGFTPACVKKRDLWGRSYYGITMALAEPHTRYGREYEYAVVTVTDDGQLSPGVIYRHSAVCGYSAALYPKEPVSGKIEVILTDS